MDVLKDQEYGHIKVCGVMTDYCVYQTIKGLAQKTPKLIACINQACAGANHNDGLTMIREAGALVCDHYPRL